MKYSLNVCNCGRIHMIESEKLDKAYEDGKELLMICGGCGTGFVFGAEVLEEDEEEVYETYTKNIKNTTVEVNKYSEVLLDDGLRVPMMTGEYATAFDNYSGRFSDMVYPDLYNIERKDITATEARDFLGKWKKDRTTVNMNRFILENNSKNEDKLKELASWGISALEWRGTDYEEKY